MVSSNLVHYNKFYSFLKRLQIVILILYTLYIGLLYMIFDVTDLVFVDTVGTGFSRAIGDTEDKEFWGLYEDAQSVADFIHTWITENSRWNSPRFILGISYGTTRAGAVA